VAREYGFADPANALAQWWRFAKIRTGAAPARAILVDLRPDVLHKPNLL
jgi:hypothetical protein